MTQRKKQNGFKKGNVPWNKGRPKSQEEIENLKVKMKGRKPWNTGKHILLGDPTKRIASIKYKMKGKTYEELFGIEKAKQLREQKSKITKELLKKVPGMGFPKDGTMIIKRSKQVFPKKDSEIEIKIRIFLESLNLEYFQHKYMNIEHAYQCDFFIPLLNLVIECDGNYWHSYPVGNEIDHIRTKELVNQGYKVIRLWESDIKKMPLTSFKELLLNDK